MFIFIFRVIIKRFGSSKDVVGILKVIFSILLDIRKMDFFVFYYLGVGFVLFRLLEWIELGV